MSWLRVRRLALRAGRIARAKLGGRTKTYARHRIDEYRRIWGSAADACGAELVEVASDVWRVERDGIGVFVRTGEIQLDDPVTLAMAGRKPLMHRLLADAGIPVPAHRVFGLDDVRPALDLLSEHPEGVVIKPANGTAAGDGVSMHLRTRRQVVRAAVLASLYDHELLAEQQVPGESYRALVVGGRMLHVACRRGPRVRGDGRSTIRQLVEEENALRAAGGADRIAIEADCVFTLGWQGLNPDAVLASGTEALVRAVENPEGGRDEIRTVYNAEVTGLVSPSIRRSVEEAAAVLGADFLGVDFITPDATRPLVETGGRINEVNTTPALHHHYDAAEETYPRVAEDVLELALRRREQRAEGDGARRSPLLETSAARREEVP